MRQREPGSPRQRNTQAATLEAERADSLVTQAQMFAQAASSFRTAAEAQRTQQALNDMTKIVPFREAVRLAKDSDPRGVGLVSSLASLSSDQLGYVANALLGNRSVTARSERSAKRPREVFAAGGSESDGSEEDAKCFGCKDVGHRFRDCPKMPQLSEQVKAAARAKARSVAARGRRPGPR
ncbi:protein ubiquitination [Pleodorina starrii]|nr:protein ubiquitination [Pleodorina starrii]